MFQFDNTYTRLPEAFYARVGPARVPEPNLIEWNDGLAERLGAQAENISDRELAEIFTGQRLLPGSDPIAMVYAGHQFGNFVPQLGDGRALLLGEAVDPSGKRHDIQLKGPGRTPFSRRGDGKAPLGPVLREYLVSEALHHLGLPTTRSLAAVKTGETVHRERPLPGAILTRVAASHIRIGTFEYFAARQDLDHLRLLADYAIRRHYPEIDTDPEAYFHFFRKVGEAQVELVTGWMALGFIHGVMNTDNASIAGETIDFGPCAFMDQFRADQVYSSIDQFGRYAYANQNKIVLWNLSRLGSCLIPLMGPDSDAEVDRLNRELESFANRFEERYSEKMLHKLGIFDGDDSGDGDLVRKWLGYLEREQLDFTLSFRNLAHLVEGQTDSGLFEESEAFKDFFESWRQRIHRQDLNAEAIRQRMNRVNPVFIPRNHKIEAVIEAGLQDDFRLFHEMNKVLTNPYTEQEGYGSYQSPPSPEQVVQATFCGT